MCYGEVGNFVFSEKVIFTVA